MSSELRRFWWLGLAVCSTLALAAVSLGAIGLVRGPELAGGTISADRAVSTAGERLLLRSRQPLSDIEPAQVAVEPAAPFTIETRDDTLTVRFTAPLAYGTAYRVDVAGVRSRHTGRTTDWHYGFTTPGADLYTLLTHRSETDTAAPDTILQLSGQDERQILSAPAIEGYAAVRGHVVAISHPDGTSSELVAVAPTGGEPVRVTAPQVESLSLLRASPDGSRFGYTATGTDTGSGRAYDNALLIQDADLSRAPEAVTSNGAALPVQDWLFVPGVAAVVALDLDGQASLVYLDSDAAPVALGRFDQLVGFLPGATSLVALSRGEEVLLDLASGETSKAPQPWGQTADALAGRRTLLGSGDYVQELSLVEHRGEETRITSRLIHVRDGQSAKLLEVAPGSGELLDSGVAPNGQTAWAVVLDPDAPVEDLTSGASEHATTLVYDLATGKAMAMARGAYPIWALR